jgi:hypothetical protein
MLDRQQRQAAGTEPRPVHQQVQRDHERQDDVEDDRAHLGQRANQVFEDVGPALLDGRRHPSLELVQVGLDAVLAEAVAYLRRSSLELGRVLWQGAAQGRRLTHERPRQQDESTDDNNADQQVDRHDRRQSIANPRGQHVDRATEGEREHRRQSEQNERVQDGAEHLPDHPQHSHAGEQRQQDDQRLLPVAVQEPASREGHRRVMEPRCVSGLIRQHHSGL